MTGRPSKYSEKTAETICKRLIEGESLRTICKDKAIPAMSTVCGWLATLEHPFLEHYAHARQIQAEMFADEMMDIADNGTNDYMETKDGIDKYNGDAIQRSKLRVDTRKWISSKLLPKKYGDKIQQEVSGKDGKDLVIKLVNFGDEA